MTKKFFYEIKCVNNKGFLVNFYTAAPYELYNIKEAAELKDVNEFISNNEIKLHTVRRIKFLVYLMKKILKNA